MTRRRRLGRRTRPLPQEITVAEVVAKTSPARPEAVIKLEAIIDDLGPRLRADDMDLAVKLISEDERGSDFTQLKAAAEAHELSQDYLDRLTLAYGLARDLIDYFDLKQLMKEVTEADEIEALNAFMKFKERLARVTEATVARLSAEWNMALDAEAMRVHLHKAVRNHARLLGEQIQALQDIYNLHDFIRSWEKAGVTAIPRPSGWNELVAKQVFLPTIDMFPGIRLNPRPGIVFARAVKALRDKDLVGVMVSLARGLQSRQLRREIGEPLMRELMLYATENRPNLEPPEL